MCEAGLIAGVSRHLCLNLGVRLSGTEEDADGLRIREKLLQKIDLLRDRGQIRGTGDISARSVIGSHEAGLCRIGNCGKHDRNGGRRCGSGLRCRCRDRIDEVIAIIYELLSDGLAGGLLTGGVLLINLVRNAGIIKGLYEAFICLIECGMLYELEYADLIGLAIARLGGRCGRRVGLRCCCGLCCCRRRCGWCGAGTTGT